MGKMLRDPTHWIAGLLGLVLSLTIATTIGSWDDIGWRLYDEFNPVATVHGKRLPSELGEIRAELTIMRHRGECRVLQVTGIEELPGRPATRTFSSRVDGLPLMNIPKGVLYQSVWRFWPTGTGKFRVEIEYSCDGRVIIVPVQWTP